VIINKTKGMIRMNNKTEQTEETPEPQKRRGLTVYAANPYLVHGLVKTKTKRTINKRGDMLIMADGGEIVAPIAGLWQAHEVDDAKFIKIFAGATSQFYGFTKAGNQMFQVLLKEVQKNINTDCLYFSFKKLEREGMDVSQATFTRGMKELMLQEFIAPQPEVGWYWLNPSMMWNGDRFAFVQEFRRKGGKFLDPRQQSLPLEEVELEDTKQRFADMANKYEKEKAAGTPPHLIEP
jgi:hypothetical protein